MKTGSRSIEKATLAPDVGDSGHVRMVEGGTQRQLSIASLDASQKRRYPSLMRRHRKLTWVLLGALLVSTHGGCYYSHLASGQLKLLWLRQPIREAAEDPAHPERTRQLLRLVESVRHFAIDLGLRVDGQYTSYVDWPGDRIVTTLVRTRPGSIEAVPHWFPIVGNLPYKGYFDRERAEAEADRLRTEEGFDVCVSAITAYSTLGWLDDPVTSPMLAAGAASLVETLLHELVHATAFLADEADFNEGVAQFIGQQASIRFFETLSSRAATSGAASDARTEGNRANWPDASRVRDVIEDQLSIALVTQAFRDRLLEIEAENERIALRAVAEAEIREKLAALPLRALDPKRVASEARLSDACIALQGSYVRDLPRHARVLAALGGDLEAMITRLAHWADANRSTEEFFNVAPSQDSTAQMSDYD